MAPKGKAPPGGKGAKNVQRKKKVKKALPEIPDTPRTSDQELEDPLPKAFGKKIYINIYKLFNL